MSVKRCFINQNNLCTHNCAAFVQDAKPTECRLINTFEKLVPAPSRPPAPPVPQVKR